jgi:hypothetical protein
VKLAGLIEHWVSFLELLGLSGCDAQLAMRNVNGGQS